VPSSALRSRLEGGGARQHSFVSDTLHVALASFFGPWGGVSVNRPRRRPEGVTVCFSRFYTQNCVRSDRAARACSRAQNGTERSIDHTARTGEDPHLHTRKDPRPDIDTPCVRGETRDSTHTTRALPYRVPATALPPSGSACVHTPVLSITPVKNACEVCLCRLGVRAIYNCAPQARGCAGGSDAPDETR